MTYKESFKSFTDKWKGFVNTPEGIKEQDWNQFFAQTNPVAGIDWGVLTDTYTDKKKGIKIQTNERKTIKDNWNEIADRFLKLYQLTDDKDIIPKLKETKAFILSLIIQNGGHKKEVATNRLLTTLYPDKLLSIPNKDDVDKLAESLGIPIDGKDWIDLCFEIKPLLDESFPDMMHWNAYLLLIQINNLAKNYNLILTGAPGTGKTYLARQMAAKMIGCKVDELDNDQRFGFVQFHPSYNYTDFVEGLRPVKDKASAQIVFELQDGIFKSFCSEAAKNENSDDKYVFVIDEINRGEISKIFGELFFSIDPGYREKKDRVLVRTQYHNLIEMDAKRDEEEQILPKDYKFKKGFYVPSNVYIIGTMNDIDRSVESMDFAFRRRFSFYEVKATDTQYPILKDCKDLQGAINRMNSLNAAIVNNAGLSPAYHLGAAYFKKVCLYEKDRECWEMLWNNHIKGLLYEYLRGLPAKEIERIIAELKYAYDNPPTNTQS